MSIVGPAIAQSIDLQRDGARELWPGRAKAGAQKAVAAAAAAAPAMDVLLDSEESQSRS